MKEFLKKLLSLPMWVRILSVCVIFVLLTGGIAVAVYHLGNQATVDNGTELTSGEGGTTEGDDVHLEADTTDGVNGTGEKETEEPTEGPTETPSDKPTETPSGDPTEKPTKKPTEKPTEKPTKKPTKPTSDPDDEPEPPSTEEPTERPTERPTETPTETPTEKPTQKPTEKPTEKPTQKPTEKPTEPEPPAPTEPPTEKPTEKPTEPAKPQSSAPTVTLCTQVGPGKMVVAGSCPIDTEYLRVSGNNVTTVDIYPDKGSSKAYFIGTVKYTKSTNVSIQCKQPGKELSAAATQKVGYSSSMPDHMTSDEYMPVFSKNSRMHFYSALLCYSLSDKVDSGIKSTAKENISSTVSKANAVGAKVIYLVAPSSAWVYPETVPDEYKKATGETVYQAFKKAAESCGATVIYPLDTMLAHKNDGFKIYHTTDSHWSTYGAYWALSDLMNHISKEFPKAKPRTVAEMKFYNKEMYAGDALFSFPDGMGFDRIQRGSSWNGATSNTKMKELAPLYEKTFGTNTLYGIFRNNRSVYINQGNSDATTVSNGGAGLPTAMVMRDSFGCTIFDMLSDRFSTVWWQASGNYRVSSSALEEARPDYLIYVVSERNLLKIMMNNQYAAITSLR